MTRPRVTNIFGDADVWWRAEDKRYANYDPWAEFEQPSGSYLQLELRAYLVVRSTPKGVWLSVWGHDEFFVRGDAKKQFALPTKELALRDLVVRKEYHVAGCKARLARAEEHLRAARFALDMQSHPAPAPMKKETEAK